MGTELWNGVKQRETLRLAVLVHALNVLICFKKSFILIGNLFVPIHKMDEVVNQNLGQLPIPAVEGVKRYLAEESVALARAAQEVDDLSIRYEQESAAVNSTDEIKDALLKEKSAALFAFYSKAKLIMRSLKPHLAVEDVKEFETNWETIRVNRSNPQLYEVEEVDELEAFIERALKNSNLLELGQKSHVKEIMTRYKI
jgi:hypothetical protein